VITFLDLHVGESRFQVARFYFHAHVLQIK